VACLKIFGKSIKEDIKSISAEINMIESLKNQKINSEKYKGSEKKLLKDYHSSLIKRLKSSKRRITCEVFW